MIFLDWNRPLLHTTADWLLDSSHVPDTPDLSGVTIVVRGQRAGRRLLELLAIQCTAQGTILIPPAIVTPARLVTRLTRPLPNEPQTATPLASALAWAEAIGNIADSDRERLFRRPGNEEAQSSLRTLLGLGRHLNNLWSEVGGADISFQDVIRILEERFPHIAEFEIPRWEVLELLHEKASALLEHHGLIDRTDLQLKRARQGELIPDQRVVLVGVVELPRMVRDLLNRLPEPPTVLVFAPETERNGFEEPGILRPDYWENRSAGLEAGQIHTVERDRDQALRAAQIVKTWHNDGVAADQITVAVPDAESLPRLREALETERFKTRWAQGRLTSDAPAFQLLRLVADYLDHAPGEPPRYEAVAALARHPDLPGISPADWRVLDEFATTHLPARFDPSSVEPVAESVLRLQQKLNDFIARPGHELRPTEAAEWTLHFLLHVYGERQENSTSPEGRIAVQGLKLLREALTDTEQGRLPWPGRVRPADFISILLGFLGEESVPEPSTPDAIQGVGWLELVEDDAPAAVVTSFHEGAVPESISSDPFLPGSLRQALSLSDNTMRLARDAYALAAILGSRSGGRGGLALIAPRFDAEENPVRPSRLLLTGLQGKALARRVWYLAGKRESEPRLEPTSGIGFPIPQPGAHPPIERLRVTAFRDYLESPRKFYFQHVLNLRSQDDAALELQGRDVGTLIHEVLAAFGRNVAVRESTDEAAIQNFITTEFHRIVDEKFGEWVQPAVEIQIEEVRRRLNGFSRAQALTRKDGWIIRHVEGNHSCPVPGEEAFESLPLTGRIDRIDFHPLEKKWRIIDYKTAARAREPLPEHRKRSEDWKDLQLPLYLMLVAPYALEQWGVELTQENCGLTYFLLPDEEAKAGISQPFPEEMIEEAWAKASEIVSKILRGEFAENPALNIGRNDPALLALCGQVGISLPPPPSPGVLSKT